MYSAPWESLVKGLVISSKRPCHSIPRCRYQQRSESFHHSCHRRFPENQQNGTDPDTVAPGLNEDQNSLTQTETGETNVKTDDSGSANYPTEQKSYGSARRRALRNRKAQDPEYSTIPAWFLRNNVSQYEGYGTSWPKSLQILQKSASNWLRRFPPHDDWVKWFKSRPDQADEVSLAEINEKKQRDLDDHFSVEPTRVELKPIEEFDGTESTSDRSQAYPYSINYFTFTELYRLYNGLMQLPQPLSAEEVSAEKSHLVLQFPGSGGHYFLDAIVRALASLNGALMITVDAQDITELASGPHSKFERSFKQASRMISYDVYRKKDPASRIDAPDPIINDEEELEEYEDESTNSAVNRQSQFTVSAQLIPISSPRDLDLIVDRYRNWPRMNEAPTKPNVSRSSLQANRRDVSRWRAIVEAIFSSTNASASKDRPENQETLSSPDQCDNVSALLTEQQWDKMKEQVLLHSELNRAEVPIHKEEQCQGDNSKSPMKDIIVQVQDIYALKENPMGKAFVQALYEHAEFLRFNGQRVMIIGTVTSSRPEDCDGARKNLISTDDEFLPCHTRVIPPVLRSHKDQNSYSDAASQRISEVNMRHFVEELRHKLETSSPWLSLGNGNIAGRVAQLELDMMSTYLSFDEIHEKAMMLLSYPSHSELEFWARDLADLREVLRGSAASRREWSLDVLKRRLLDSAKNSGKRDSTTILEGERTIKDLAKRCDKYEQKFLGGVIEPSKISTTFAGVHVPHDVVDTLKTLTSLSITRPEAFSYGVLATDKIPGLLMYGPPGTGKTLLAKAVAKESGAHVLEVSGAEVFDMYVGEAEKNIKALFSLAKKLNPCVVFIDEADALFGSRSGMGSRQRTAHREVINQFLKEWDGMNNDAGSAFIMVATNRPFDLDDAVLRRLPRRVLVDLPTEKDRLEILKIHLREENLADDVDLTVIAKQTPFYSGSDLKNVCVAAALNCVKEENKQANEHDGQEPYKFPERRTLSAVFFEKALNEITASISEDMNSLKDIRKFDEQYGDKRKDRKKAKSWGFRNPGDDERHETVKVRALA